MPPPAIMPSPLLWGDEAKLGSAFGDGISELRVQPVMIAFRLDELKPANVVEFWRQYYRPTQRAFEALAADSGNKRRCAARWNSCGR